MARIKPECNQVESHPFFAQAELLATCRKLGVLLTAYSPLGSPGNPAQVGVSAEGLTVPKHPVLATIGKAHGKSAAQVALAWNLARGVPTFPKSTNAARIAQVRAPHPPLSGCCAEAPSSRVETAAQQPSPCGGVLARSIASKCCRSPPPAWQNIELDGLALSDEEMQAIGQLDRGSSGRGCFGGPKVEREGRWVPRDLAHRDYPWNEDGSERA